jgi:DNA-binding MarR family transcriptional regulator
MKDNFKIRKFQSEYHKLMANINYTGAFITAALQRVLEVHNLTHPQFIILRALQYVAPENLSMSEVKEQMHDRNSDITRLVDRLIEKELVIRENDPLNRRKVKLALSPLAIELLIKIDKAILEFETRLHDFSEQEVNYLNELLDKIRERIAIENEK